MTTHFPHTNDHGGMKHLKLHGLLQGKYSLSPTIQCTFVTSFFPSKLLFKFIFSVSLGLYFKYFRMTKAAIASLWRLVMTLHPSLITSP